MYVPICIYVLPAGQNFTMTEGHMSQEVILDMFFEILNIEVPDWGQAFMDGRRLTSEYQMVFLGGDTDGWV